MENIQKFSSRFCILLQVFMVVLPLATILYWQFFPFFSALGIQVSNTPLELMHASQKSQAVALLANLLPVSNIVIGLYLLNKLFQNFAAGLVFSMDNVEIYRKIGVCLFCLSITDNLFDSLITYIMTYESSLDTRALSFGYDSAQIIYIVIGGLILITSKVMREAYQLQVEVKYTI